MEGIQSFAIRDSLQVNSSPWNLLELESNSFSLALRTMSVRPFGIIVGSSGALGRAYAPILSSSSCINGLYKGLIGLDINPSNDIDGLTKVLALSGTVDDSSIIDPINTITQSEGAIVQAVVHCAGR
jgi:hypothetical protein